VSGSRDQLLEELRPAVFAIAYRMLGSVAEAEDVVQEALLRLHTALESGERIESPRAYVATVATRLAIDVLRSARVRRETYVGDWLPEPLVSDRATDPARHAEMADSLSLAFLVLLESLSPEQRAVFLLHDVFDYGYGEVAEIVGKSEDNARQLAARARRHVEEGKPRFEASREERDELAHRFFAAARDGEVDALETLLADDVVLQGDGGGKVPALARALHGSVRVARTLVAWMRAGAKITGASLREVDVNGQPGALMLAADGRLIGVMALEIADGRIQGVKSIVNPDKLRHLGHAGDLGEALGRGSSAKQPEERAQLVDE
jgi:RNA polymerase sigma-70 factor (ECF subfamily)